VKPDIVGVIVVGRVVGVAVVGARVLGSTTDTKSMKAFKKGI
jgi:hypothetical protein